MGLRTRRVRKAGYREVISRIGTEGRAFALLLDFLMR